MSRIRRGLLLSVVIGGLLSGCAFSRLEKQVNLLSRYGVMSGSVVGEPRSASLRVAAYAVNPGTGAPVDQHRLADSGRFSFVLPSGDYLLLAFADGNDNGKVDDDEATGYLHVDAGQFMPSELLENLVIEVTSTSVLPDAVKRAASMPRTTGRRQSVEIGAIANLDDPIFSAAYGHKGLWEPQTFVQEVRGGVFLLEPYSPLKTPILFIHGAGGSPQDWRTIFNNLDRTRFQPWFYYYPSAIRLNDAAFWLNNGVQALHARHGFNQLIVTAHSMGGLVASRFIEINQAERGPDYVKLLVSVSTPWSGVSAAQWGLDFAPAVVPSWMDVAPASRFLARMRAGPLPSGLDYYLLYSCRDGATKTTGFDGVVTVESQLDGWARDQAVAVFGFEAGHLGALKDPQLLARYFDILDLWSTQHESRLAATHQAAQGQGRTARGGPTLQ